MSKDTEHLYIEIRHNRTSANWDLKDLRIRREEIKKTWLFSESAQIFLIFLDKGAREVKSTSKIQTICGST